MLDVERDAGRGTRPWRWALSRIMSMPFGSWSAGAARAHSAGLVSAWCRRNLRRLLGAFRVQLVHLSPNFVNVRQKDSPALTCSAASRRRTAPLMWCSGRRCTQCGRPFRCCLSIHRIHMRIRPIPPWKDRSPVRPAPCRTLSFAASANAEPGCARYFHSPASRYSRLMKRWSGTRGPDLITLAKRCNRWGFVTGGVARESSTVVRCLFMTCCSDLMGRHGQTRLPRSLFKPI
jgi:hypothetical protein